MSTSSHLPAGGEHGPGVPESALAGSSTDFGLAIYLGVLGLLVLYVVVVSGRRWWCKRSRAPDEGGPTATELDADRERARREQQDSFQRGAEGDALRRRQTRRGPGRLGRESTTGRALGADPAELNEIARKWAARQSGEHKGTDGDSDGVSLREAAVASRLASELGLRWNEGTLPQPPPLHTFFGGSATSAGAPARAAAAAAHDEIRRQDAAYEESLRVDQAREAEEALLKAAQEESIRAIEEAELRELQEAEDREVRRAEARALATSRVGEEPADGAPVVVKLPDGQRIQRKFLPTDQVQELVDWVHSTVEVGEGFTLSTAFPSKVLWTLLPDDRSTQCYRQLDDSSDDEGERAPDAPATATAPASGGSPDADHVGAGATEGAATESSAPADGADGEPLAGSILALSLQEAGLHAREVLHFRYVDE